MGIKFDFDADKFARDLNRAVKETANAAVQQVGSGLQSACDTVAATHPGATPDETFEALKIEIARRRLPVDIPDQQIRDYAEAIAAGRKITVKVEGMA